MADKESDPNVLECRGVPTGDPGVPWWGYIHESGSVMVKRYYDQIAIDAAKDSPFVRWVIPPFMAENRKAATEYILRMLPEIANGKD